MVIFYQHFGENPLSHPQGSRIKEVNKIKEVEKGKSFSMCWADGESVSSFSLKTRNAEATRGPGHVRKNL